ncbi:MAG TPA: glyceraldehyde 3-phosphate dehydrogenase NAD-binding domain-containing protein, partial [Ginsengibacter sp.]|nr:glyceraldehyde 3-phosphate dehydrogenase NAD-binding domain-containing protein [Ginsengibacter sp.]
MRIAINGMGRIGRLLFRRLIDDENIKVVAVNDIMPVDNLAYLIKYDSVYGTFAKDIIVSEESIEIQDKKIAVFQKENPEQLPWKDMHVDLVLECSGSFSTKEKAGKHLTAGAKKVLLSTTGADDIPLLIYGFNQSRLTDDINIISPGGCMTNCSIHVLYILNSISIISAHINILHSYTSRQELVDAPNKNFRRGRAAAESIIPVEIDLHRSMERLMPAMQNKVASSSIRVPVANGAMAIFSIQLHEEVTAEHIKLLFKKAANNSYKGIIDYTDEPVVSLDIKGNTHSCIIDGTLTSVIGNHCTIVAWFDNEYGFTSRMIDL